MKRWTTAAQEEAAVAFILLGILVVVLVALFGCGAPTAPAPYERVHVLCTLTRVNDSTLVDSCR